MLLNYQYRIYPETNQNTELNVWRRICQYWLNWQLGDRFLWWENNRNYINSCPLVCSISNLRDNPDRFSQQALLPKLKKDLVFVRNSGELLDFTRVPAQTLQDVTKRANKAFERYISGDKKGSRSGKPRFKSFKRYRTLYINGQGVNIVHQEKDWLFMTIPKLKGWMRIRYHRPLPEGFTIKNILLTRKADGWYVTFSIENKNAPKFNPDEIQATWENSMGMDAVLHEDDYLATSEGTKLPSLKSFRKNEKRLAKVSARKSSKKKGSRKRKKLAKREAKIHQRIARSRLDHAFKTSHALVRTGKKVFIHEKLNLKALSKRNKAKKDENGKFLPNGQSAKSGLNKSWNDAAFAQFFKVLEYIAGKAGSKTIAVKPAYTSSLILRYESIGMLKNRFVLIVI